MGYIMMRNVAIAVLERLRYTQVELAARGPDKNFYHEGTQEC